MPEELVLRVFDVDHGACTILSSPAGDRLAMIDCGDNTTTDWRPSTYIRYTLNRIQLDYLFITNADQDHVSDLNGLWQHGINVVTLYRNPSPEPAILRAIKEIEGDITTDMERYLQIHSAHRYPAPVPFNTGMGGVTCTTFCSTFPEFQDTNNLSLAVFIKYGAFNMLFPGDLEVPGWQALLHNPSFVAELRNTSILVASHHGRTNGFCEDIFRYFTPLAVVVSDKPIVHDTQETVPDYRDVVAPAGVIVANQIRRRHVLTTRRDGDIVFTVYPSGQFHIRTSND